MQQKKSLEKLQKNVFLVENHYDRNNRRFIFTQITLKSN